MLTSPIRYVLIGGLCALLHNAIMIGGDAAGLHYAASLVISFMVVVVVGYLLHAGFTFRAPLSGAAFVRYAIPMATNYPLTLAGLFVLCDLAGLSVRLAAPALTIFMFALNYLFSRWAILGSDRQ